MRLMIEFEDSDHPDFEVPALKDFVTWINDFPCRIVDGDIIMPEVISTECCLILMHEHVDNPTVTGTRFEKDEDGYFQHVWLAL